MNDENARDFSLLTKKWQEEWARAEVYKTPEKLEADRKFYCLDMFPYPSGLGLHVGHVEGYTASDILSRFKRMSGYQLIHPMGWDSFGLPAENYAIKTGVHPEITTNQAIKSFTKQMNSLGLSYDWKLEIQTSRPEYYRWTQWFFLLLYRNGLAYKKKAKVNWCQSCATVLANEQAEGGQCERCGSQVIQKDLEQWFFKISDFIEDQQYQGRVIKGLLNGLDDVNWPESTKLAQKNWIGRSSGAQVVFKIKDRSGREENLEVFTTRPDTLFACTYLAVNPEHEIIEKFSQSLENLSEIRDYAKQSQNKTEIERTGLNREKSGLEMKGLFALNPVNGEEIKIFVVDYVLSGYGSGAVMAVPAHDERDYDFARKYNLPIKEVVAGGDLSQAAYTGDGILINSDFLNGLKTEEAQKKIIHYLSEKKLGRAAVNYRLRDWLVSRQRYWGAPIPIIYCDSCGQVAVEEKDLPVLLPQDVSFKAGGQSPLAESKTFHQVACPRCGAPARRENDTLDTFVCSAWYYFRYLDPHNDQAFAAADKIRAALPVDVYVGGSEHSLLHLLYARFFTKVLQKYGLIDFNEPFLKLKHPGIILGEDGNKMSKSKGNVVNPDEAVKNYGPDCLRMYEMFIGAFEDFKPWNTRGLAGIRRFLDKVDNLSDRIDLKDEGDDQSYRKLALELDKSIKKIGNDIEDFKFNTAISQLMILVNVFSDYESIPKKYFSKLLLILAPLAPFLSEELWAKIGQPFSIHQQAWPTFDEALIATEKIVVAVQINGKTRGSLEVRRDAEEKEVVELIKNDSRLSTYLLQPSRQIIYVKNKIINLII